ncbi:MAG: DoxX family protein [Hyphomicrobium sp.]|jgi:putative oxidoreductase|uniref:DoxX family protein n=1 Tax=Hyphomicrobium sp. TaxID=82 RepID=UPI0025BED13B|nr:DoxX family protein [Hyphomicrobium sp.]MBX9861786.1 DoxX family protein [Hyphomicrobium sp.]
MSQSNTRYFLPALAPLYASFHEFAETLLRVLVGFLLVLHGAPKFANLDGVVGMVESLGFYPGAVWAPLLAATETIGGLLLMIGLFTRPAAFATTIVLLVTVYFHWIFKAEGFAGAEKSLIWAAVLFFFVIRGGNAHSVDARLGREF